MNRASQIVVLCEDKLQEVGVCRFLKKGWGVAPRAIRVIPCPAGKGSGERHVRTRYPEELKAYRTRSAKAQTVLMVVIDADTESVSHHQRELNSACRTIPSRQGEEAVMHVIPKRHIETWLAYLDGQAVNEDEDYKPQYQFRGKESECYRLIDRLAETCKRNLPLAPPPPSLRLACDEFSSRMFPSL